MAQVEAPAWAEVALSIYDLHGTWAINGLTKTVGLGGAFHVGVEIYWLEWSYGWTPTGTGVHVVHVGQSWQGSLRDRVPLGRTPFSCEKVVEILANLRKEWPGRSYHPLRQNCGHFCAELAQRLKVQDVPSWINSLAATGDQIAGLVNGGGLEAVDTLPTTSPLWWLGWVSQGSLASKGSLAECRQPAKALTDEKKSSPAKPANKEQNDPRLEKEWRWATDHMLTRAREASGSTCLIA